MRKLSEESCGGARSSRQCSSRTDLLPSDGHAPADHEEEAVEEERYAVAHKVECDLARHLEDQDCQDQLPLGIVAMAQDEAELGLAM
jgi:hypothetical protein